MTEIKICGLTKISDIEAANELKIDYIGFVFAQKSRRYIAPQAALGLRAALAGDIRAVGVFVREPLENIVAMYKNGVIDMAQLHGGEDEGYISALRAAADIPIISAFRIADAADGRAAARSSADYILLDNGAGGTGQRFDWQLAKSLGRPYFLAGGLTPGNAAQAVRALHPYAVDVSSGVETDGTKDINKMKEFVRNVRAADRNGATL